MLIRANSAKCIGIDAVRVTVEVSIERGIGIHLVGLADAAVKESLLRTTTALEALAYKVPGKKIVINLAPAALHKNGSGFDLPIALGIISASGQAILPALEDFLIMGELGLDGSLRPIPGAITFADLAAKENFKGIILPEESALEAVEIPNIQIYGAQNLKEVVGILEHPEKSDSLLIWNSPLYSRLQKEKTLHPEKEEIMDFADIIGQEGAKRAAEIAVSGSHNLIMIGTPGSGKSSIAKAMAGILPVMTRDEALTTSKIYSIAGKLHTRLGLMRQRPFRAPHCSASIAAIIGGGGGDNIFPGEVTLASNGILFLDEMGQISQNVLEALRAPLEDRKVTISRLRSKVEYPASFMLVGASNPCPCGYYGDGDRCSCTPSQRANYLAKLSGPIMDRIDLQVNIKPVPTRMIMSAGKAESSASIAKRVMKARMIQNSRFASESINCNADMNSRQIEKYCPLSRQCQDILEKTMEKTGLSMRAYFRIIKVARTIADLDGSHDIKPAHLMEAVSYRFLDKVKNLTD